VGTVWRKYPKEASVFRIRLPAPPFVRSDQSLDLFRARQALLGELQRVVGEVRDYNGGMISKQLEIFENVQKALGNLAKQQELLLENFFHSILPVEQRGLLNPQYIVNLFLMFLELVEKEATRKEETEMETREEPKLLYIMMAMRDLGLKNKLMQAIETLGISSVVLPSVAIQMAETLYIGFLYFTEDPSSRARLLETLRGCV
jgi:hypothetical protein